MTVSLAWIETLFKRFDDIYLDRAKLINRAIQEWTFALDGISGQAIKSALEICKKDSMILPTPESFKELCKGQSVADDRSSTVLINQPAETHPMDVHVTALPSLNKCLKTSPSVSNNMPRGEGWADKLLAMDEVSAMGLSNEDKYDRSRLILERHGRENVRINMEYAAMQPTPTKQSAGKRKDWD